MIPVRSQRGIELPGHGIWLDPWDSKPFAFVSHAHSDHTGHHAEFAHLGGAFVGAVAWAIWRRDLLRPSRTIVI